MYKISYKDESIAEGILKKVPNLKEYEITYTSTNYGYDLTFEIDGFKISIIWEIAHDIKIKIDGVKLDASETTCNKIYKIVNGINSAKFNVIKKEREKEEEFIKKDARLHFK